MRCLSAIRSYCLQSEQVPDEPDIFEGEKPLSTRAHTTPAWQNSPSQLELRARQYGPSPSHSLKVPIEPDRLRLGSWLLSENSFPVTFLRLYGEGGGGCWVSRLGNITPSVARYSWLPVILLHTRTSIARIMLRLLILIRRPGSTPYNTSVAYNSI